MAITYKPNSDLTFFGAYKQGFKSGSFNTVNFIAYLHVSLCRTLKGRTSPSECDIRDASPVRSRTSSQAPHDSSWDTGREPYA